MSSETSSRPLAIRMRGLGKAYRITHRRRRDTLAETVMERLRHPFRRSEAETLWALRDVDLDVARGEVLGLVGRNGAGKTTLLKVLSRITEPTTGEAIVRGRVGSLLEVGTGFHKELTGRENIFLNGSILGMTRKEVRERFDAIVDFSGVETFLDTPVKRYSSGMYVRLAFAVAAHFDPDILIVDEVLAVGDAEFQRKCLGRMEDVRRSGRTVLFVSHNKNTVLNLCTRAALFDQGRLVRQGDVREIVELHDGGQAADDGFRPEHAARRGDQRVRIVDFEVRPAHACTGDRVELHFTLERRTPGAQRVELGFGLLSEAGDRVLEAYSRNTHAPLAVPAGRSTYVASLDRLPLVPGRYRLNLWVGSGTTCMDFLEDAYRLTVHPGSHGSGTFVEDFGFKVSLPMTWRVASSLPENVT